MLEPSTHMLVALSLLRFQNLDALPVGFRKTRSQKIAVSGYSCLSEVLALGPGDYGEFLNEPCEAFSVKLSVVDAEADLEDLLRVVDKTGFGFVCLDGKDKHEVGAFVGLSDLVGLYQKGLVKSDLTIGDVSSSPIFSLPQNTSLKRALGEMIEHGMRRVLIEGTSSVVTDRSIINHIFSVSKLSQASDSSYDLLGTTLAEIETSQAGSVSSTAKLSEAAELMLQTRDHCLISEKGIVTPWDLIIKPWEQKALKISG